MRDWMNLWVVGGVVSLLACGPAQTLELPDSGSPGWLVGVPTEGGGELDAGGPPDAGALAVAAVADLRADVNRNGLVDLEDPTEDEGEESWDAQRGAVFLANLDDDTKRCPLLLSNGRPYPDAELAACHDAADEVVNGSDDLLDLAPLHLKPWADAPDDAVGLLDVASPGDRFIRLFRKSQGSFAAMKVSEARFTAADLRAGVELALEGKDIVRDPAVWNGTVDITLVVQVPALGARPQSTASDTVRLRVAPVITFHHNLAGEGVYATQLPGSDSTKFVSELTSAVSSSGISQPLNVFKERYTDDDPWTQDYFEPGYMSMPAPGGGQHVMRVNDRSANLYYPGTSRPLRPAGVVVFKLRGKDVAAIQEFDPNGNQDMDSLNSFGNTETIPPFELAGQTFPLGRLLRGSVPGFHTDKRFSKMIAAQGMQPQVLVDTSWLLVGHVDETLSFLKANTPRGWVLLANDPRLAKQMLEDLVAQGHGSAPMFEGKKWQGNFGQEYSAETTVSATLANATVMNESAKAAAEVDAQLAILKQETGITDSEIIRVPFLHDAYDGYSLAYQPGTVNALVLNDKYVVMADPFGPVINGQDVFKDQLEKALAPLGYTIRWIDDWNLYHRNMGEVHCGTNTLREIPSTKWWETGR